MMEFVVDADNNLSFGQTKLSFNMELGEEGKELKALYEGRQYHDSGSLTNYYSNGLCLNYDLDCFLKEMTIANHKNCLLFRSVDVFSLNFKELHHMLAEMFPDSILSKCETTIVSNLGSCAFWTEGYMDMPAQSFTIFEREYFAQTSYFQEYFS